MEPNYAVLIKKVCICEKKAFFLKCNFKLSLNGGGGVNC